MTNAEIFIWGTTDQGPGGGESPPVQGSRAEDPVGGLRPSEAEAVCRHFFTDFDCTK